jgi:hypothetical protein
VAVKKIGFTGTQAGMSERQKGSLHAILVSYGCSIFCHGDCVGADAEAHDIAKALGTFVTIFPPENPSKRAFKRAEVTHAPKPYLARNRDIVDACDLLVVAPKTDTEELRSGTWSTKRYAERIGKPFTVLAR